MGGLCYNSLAASGENIVLLLWGGGRLVLRPDVSRSASESGEGRVLPSALCWGSWGRSVRGLRLGMGRKPPVQPRRGGREVMRDARSALLGQRSVVELSLCS